MRSDPSCSAVNQFSQSISGNDLINLASINIMLSWSSDPTSECRDQEGDNLRSEEEITPPPTHLSPSWPIVIVMSGTAEPVLYAGVVVEGAGGAAGGWGWRGLTLPGHCGGQ